MQDGQRPRPRSELEFRRGRGITVAGTPERGAVLRSVNELVEFARAQSYRRDELIGMIERAPWPRVGNG